MEEYEINEDMDYDVNWDMVDTTNWDEENNDFEDTRKKEVEKEKIVCPSCLVWELRQNKMALWCSNYKDSWITPWCKFTIWNTSIWHTWSEEEKEYMIRNKESKVVKFKSKQGKEFDGKMVFEKWLGFNLKFN